jgi:endoglucanase
MENHKINDLLRELLTVPGLSGREAPILEHLHKAWFPLVDELRVNPLGSLQGLVKGSAPPPRPSILFAAHMDAIGLMVSGFRDDFIRVTAVGGVDPRVLPGTMVTVHGKKALPGVIHQLPRPLLPPSTSKKTVEMQHLLVDVGLEEEALRDLVRIGNLVSFRQEPFFLGEEVIAGPALDNRASVAATTLLLNALQSNTPVWDVWVVATSQEEENMSGAMTSAYAIQPDLAVAVDVTFASGPGAPEHKSYPLGEGIPLGWGPSVHPALYRAFEEVAEEEDMSVTMEPLPARSVTDADVLQISAAGIPTMLLSIPLRYMHTPVEMVSVRDVRGVARLMGAFIARLEPDSLATFQGDE